MLDAGLLAVSCQAVVDKAPYGCFPADGGLSVPLNTENPVGKEAQASVGLLLPIENCPNPVELLTLKPPFLQVNKFEVIY